MRIGSRAAVTREPRQVRKEAAINAARRVPRIGLVRAGLSVGHADAPVDGGCTAKTTIDPTLNEPFFRLKRLLAAREGIRSQLQPNLDFRRIHGAVADVRTWLRRRPTMGART